MNDLHIEIYRAIIYFTQENGYSPSYREIVELTNASSLSTINKYLCELRELGYIEFNANVSRSIRVF